MKKDKKESHYEKVEIIKIPYKLFRKKLYEDSQGNPLLTYRKNHM